MEAVPRSNGADVTDPRECRWHGPGRDCDACADGHRLQIHGDPPEKITGHYVLQCYRAQRYRQRLADGGVSGKALGRTFAAARLDEHNRAFYRLLSTPGRWDYARRGLYIHGPNGTGKSYTLAAIAHVLAEHGIRFRRVRSVDMLSEIGAAHESGSELREQMAMGEYRSVPVLLVDDLGKESMSSNYGRAAEQLWDIIDARAEAGLPVIVTSNYPPEELEARYGTNYGSAIVARLKSVCQPVELGGPNRWIEEGSQ